VQREIELPAYTGKKLPVVVLPLGLSKSAAGKYPRLRDLAVGFGVHNILVDTLYEAGGFTLLEDKPEVIDEMLKRQWADAAGVVSQATAIEHGNLTGAKYILYGEVYDFGVGTVGRSTGMARERTDTVHIGVQIRLVSVSTGEFVPASGTGRSGLTTAALLFADEAEHFRATDIGTATRRAIRRAVGTLIERMPEK